MNEIQFAYWLKGYFELSNSNELTTIQIQIIKEHLDLVFNKVTRKEDMNAEDWYTGFNILDTKHTGISSMKWPPN